MSPCCLFVSRHYPPSVLIQPKPMTYGMVLPTVGAVSLESRQSLIDVPISQPDLKYWSIKLFQEILGCVRLTVKTNQHTLSAGLYLLKP